MTSTRTVTAIALAAAGLCGAPAHAASFNDSFVLSTQGQNPWGVGGFDQTAETFAWSYDSGFLGAKWGSYDGKAPASFGLNAITGSANELVPFTGGTVLNPVWSTWSVLKLGPEPTKYSPNPVPAQYVDTRTGFDLGVKTSGKLGMSVYASASAGEVALNLPFTAKLNVPTTRVEQFDRFQILGSAVLNDTASMNIKAPYLKTGINASVHTDSQLGITACVIGAGCSNSGTKTIRESFDFNAVDFDTRRGTPLQVIGQPMLTPAFNEPLPIVTHKGSIGEIKVGMPKDLVGGEVTRGHALTDAVVKSQGRDMVVKIDYDVIALALIAVPAPPLDFNLYAGQAKIQGTAVSETAGFEAWLNQSFSFDAGASVRLEFDRNVTSEYSEAGQTRRLGRFVTIDLGPESWGSNSEMVYYFEDGPGKLLSYQYMIDDESRLLADASWDIEGVLRAKAGCFNFEVPGFNVNRECAFDREKRFADLPQVPYFSSEAAIGGFNTVTVAVPEPSTYATLLLGLGVLGATARRRSREQQDTSTTPQR